MEHRQRHDDLRHPLEPSPTRLRALRRPFRSSPQLLALLLAAAALTTSAPLRAEFDRQRCLLCHNVRGMRSGPDSVPVPFVDTAPLDGSSHASLRCDECHVEVISLPHEPGLRRAACDRCHEEEAFEHSCSVHSRLDVADDDARPRCEGCHGGHDIAPASSPSSKVFPSNVPGLCRRCHEDQALVTEHEISIRDPYERFAEGVHGRGLFQSGLLVSATCNDCHGTHLILKRENPSSTIHRTKVSSTCGACHASLVARYETSVHGRALGREHSDDVPACTDCHGTHSIEDPTPEAFHARTHTICARCHSDAERMARHDLNPNVLETFLDDFHGRSNRLYAASSQAPSRTIATCTDCHGIHDIQPFDHEGSEEAIRGRVVTLCRRCHGEVPEQFADAWLSHSAPSPSTAPIVWLVGLAYRILIPAIMAGLILHILLHLWGTSIRRRRERSAP